MNSDIELAKLIQSVEDLKESVRKAEASNHLAHQDIIERIHGVKGDLSQELRDFKKENHNEHEALGNRVNQIERFSYLCIGGVLILSFIIPQISEFLSNNWSSFTSRDTTEALSSSGRVFR